MTIALTICQIKSEKCKRASSMFPGRKALERDKSLKPDNPVEHLSHPVDISTIFSFPPLMQAVTHCACTRHLRINHNLP